MKKKILITLLALSFLLIPVSTFASAGSVTKGTIKYYTNQANQDLTGVRQVTVKADKIDVGLTKVNTTEKNLTKLKKLNTKLDSTLYQAERNSLKAKSILDAADKTGVLSKGNLSKVKNYLKLAGKQVTSARYQEKDLRRRLQNLKVTL